MAPNRDPYERIHMFLQSDTESTLTKALSQLERMTPGSPEYLMQTEAIKNLAEALKIIKEID